MFTSEASITRLEELIVEQLGNFMSRYKEEKLRIRPSSEQPPTARTLFMLGKAKKVTESGWDGVLPMWIQEVATLMNIKIIEPVREMYQVDLAAREDCSTDNWWWDGKYKLHLLIDHENNPEEVYGHTRTFFDFAVPEKLLITWTNDKNNDPLRLLENAEMTVQWCHENNVTLSGKLTVIVGEWDKLVETVSPNDAGYSGKILHARHF